MKKWVAVIAASLCLLAAAALFGAHRGDGGYGAVLRMNWGFQLPLRGSCDEAYQAYLGYGSHGDGLRYHVYACRNTHLSSMYGWLAEDRATVFHDSMRAAADDWLGQMDVAEQWRPRCEDCLFLYQTHADNSELLVFWNKDAETLYVLESFL
ncbi:MAG: hypothetical protein E7425_09670 [Ruminococcaceae bacterium]|jgi:hypothetical protein|nr:hypothetical protein [Oscillospiraceae bacterium]